ncbi:MAG: PhoH family protein [Phycisphaeraceae bacterium]|nr:PhoH family protein [Phycisphaeraceae bacterium]
MDVTIQVPEGAERVVMLGLGDRNLKMIREALGVKVSARAGTVTISGDRDAVASARGVLEYLRDASDRGDHLERDEVLELIGRATDGARSGRRRRADGNGFEADGMGGLPEPGWHDGLDVYSSGQRVRPKSPNQDRYLQAIRDNDLVFGIGPAGTGKTYLAVAAAVQLLKSNRVKRLILVRPAVEAGERLGFLPGDIEAKVHPYLRPLLDALHDMMDYATIKRFMLSDVVEIVPLAYMRGRTLNNACIILDEAQNSTRGQMQMFLTRMGHGSKTIVNGDTTQIDLPDPTASGLVDAARRLRRVPGVDFVTLDRADIVRHPLVQRIVEAYGNPEHPERADLIEQGQGMAKTTPESRGVDETDLSVSNGGTPQERR